ncbi:MAG: alginate lyase family protein, partial [Candidatus Hodarchaeota archaeon]
MGKIQEQFFKKNLFSYSNESEKKNLCKFLEANCSNHIKKYREFAENILQKKFSIFEKNYIFKDKINWHYSFFRNYNWPFKNSNEIEIRPKNVEVDVKYVWEFNRHQYFNYLGVLYFISGEEKYAIAFKNQILNWIRDNPPLIGVNWYSGLEISLRLTSWIFTLMLLYESKEINNNDFFQLIFKSMYQHAYYLKNFYLRRSFNHTVGELFGLYFFSKIFTGIKPFNRWERKFSKRLKNQIILQTRSDGVNIEQSLNYHRFVLEYFSLFSILKPNLGKKEKRLIEKMYEYLLYMIKPNGSFPLIGDFDDGKVHILNFYEKDLYKQLINLGAILFKRKDFKFASDKLFPNNILLTSLNHIRTFNELQPKKPKNFFKYFKNSGYFIIRNNWDENANYLFVDFGKFGPQTAAHSHSSITNFIFSYKGKDIIVDSGTYTYNKSWDKRNLFRSSKSHNVLTINDQNQAKIVGWFAWKNKPRIRRKFEIKSDQFHLSCFHNGYNG